MLSREWFSLSELRAEVLPGLPESASGMAAIADTQGWNAPELEGAQWRRRQGRGGGVEYHFSLLNSSAQAVLVVRYTAAAPAREEAAQEEHHREDSWAWFARQKQGKRDEAARRLSVLQAIDAAVQHGQPKVHAARVICAQRGVTLSRYYDWRKAVSGLNPADWLPALAPRHAGATQAEAECSDDAWEWIKADWLRPEQPSFTACYRRLQAEARARGWTVPSQQTLHRRMMKLPETTRVFHREGAEALKRMMPAQVRDKSSLHALEVVNLDDHKFDCFVRWPDGVIARPHLEAAQDVYSGMLLAWRVDRSENTQAIRLTIHDLVKQWGIPAEFVFDNTRAAANKQITGGAPNRFRFKVREEDPGGLIDHILRARVRFTTPYHGQAKPVERMFRDAAGEWAKHPAFAGAYTGNNPTAKPSNYGSAAVPLDRFVAVLSELIEEHNTRLGRRSAVCNGRSFRQAFDESYAVALERLQIRRPTADQCRFFLLQAEAVTVRREQPMIHLQGNRYFAPFLFDLRGTKVVIRFDADALHDGIHVESLDGRYIGFAECKEARGFSDLAAAREDQRTTAAINKAERARAAALKRMNINQLAERIAKQDRAEPAPPPESKVVRPMFGTVGNTALKPRADELQDERPEHAAQRQALTLAFPAPPRRRGE